MTADFAKESVSLEILLPEGSRVQVKVGDKVVRGQPVASREGKVKEIDLSKLLGISAKRVGKHLLSSLGSQVKKGQMLAEKKGLFKKKLFKSPIDGVLESLSEKGILKIREKTEGQEIKIPANGKVKKIKEERVLIQVPVVKVTGDWAIGESTWGLLKICSSKEKNELSDLGEEIEDKLLVFKGEVPVGLVYKAEALGATGLVVGKTDKLAKCDQLAVLSLGGQEGVIPGSLWTALAKFEDKPGKILTEEKLLIIAS